MMTRPPLFAFVVLLAAGCVRPAEERTLEDLEVGIADDGAGLGIEVAEGAAQVRSIGGGSISMWAQAPILRAEASAAVDTAITLTVENCMPGAELAALASGRPLAVTALGGGRPTVCRFAVELPGGEPVALELAPPDAGTVERFRFAAMGDIQTALPEVGDVFARINAEPGLRFVKWPLTDVVSGAYTEEIETEALGGLRAHVESYCARCRRPDRGRARAGRSPRG